MVSSCLFFFLAGDGADDSAHPLVMAGVKEEIAGGSRPFLPLFGKEVGVVSLLIRLSRTAMLA